MGFIFNEEVVKGLKIIEGGGGAEVEDRGEGVAEDEVIICAGGNVRRGEGGGGQRGTHRRESFLESW